MRRVHAEILNNLRKQLGLIPDNVVQALHVLDLPQDTSFDEVRQRYRLLTKQYQDDTGGDEKQFIEVNTAYNQVIA